MQNDTRNHTETKPLLYQHESFLIRDACFAIYKKFRNTQKESIYQKSLAIELENMKLQIAREKQLAIYHLGIKVGVYTPDLLVNFGESDWVKLFGEFMIA